LNDAVAVPVAEVVQKAGVEVELYVEVMLGIVTLIVTGFTI
jgi:hypothetical protein